MTSPALDPVEELSERLCDEMARAARVRGNLVEAQYDWEFTRHRDGDKYRDLARYVLAREEKYRAVVEAARGLVAAVKQSYWSGLTDERHPYAACPNCGVKFDTQETEAHDSSCGLGKAMSAALAALDQHKGDK